MMPFAVCALAASPIARGGPDDAPLLTEVKQLASQGQNAQTTAQVNQFVDQNQGAISTILQGWVNYLKQIEKMAADPDLDPATQTQPAQPTQPTQPAQQIGRSRDGRNGEGSGRADASIGTGSGGFQASGAQPPNAQPNSSVQASGPLRTSHLAGYPSLPDVDPVSSIGGLTAAQMQYAAMVERQMQERKQYLMQHPEGYTY